ACESHDSVEPNDLGITELQVRRERVQDERVLTVRGLDPTGATIATAVLRTGMVMYGADMAEELHPGTELKIIVKDTVSSFVSPDRVPHVIYQPLSEGTATFVGLHGVAAEIEREAGIRFAPHSDVTVPGELAFTAGACSGSRFPVKAGGSS